MSKNIDSGNRELYLVSWKNQRNHVELFDELEVFAASYPRYDLAILGEALRFGNTVFEDSELRIEKKQITSSPKPDFSPMYFWDFRYDKIDWQASRETVIQRILERGMREDWKELVRYYNMPTIIEALKDSITYLPDESIEEASLFFKLNKEAMLCYKRKQSHQIPWL